MGCKIGHLYHSFHTHKNKYLLGRKRQREKEKRKAEKNKGQRERENRARGGLVV